MDTIPFLSSPTPPSPNTPSTPPINPSYRGLSAFVTECESRVSSPASSKARYGCRNPFHNHGNISNQQMGVVDGEEEISFPLKPPPCSHQIGGCDPSTPKSPMVGFDPFEAAFDQIMKEDNMQSLSRRDRFLMRFRLFEKDLRKTMASSLKCMSRIKGDACHASEPLMEKAKINGWMTRHRGRSFLRPALKAYFGIR